MASSPETAPPGDNNDAESPPADPSTSSSPPPSKSPPEAPPQSPPPAPPHSPPQAPPQSPPSSTPSPPSAELSPPSAELSPPQPPNAPPASPPPSATPSLSPPTEAGSPPSPSNSEQPPSNAEQPPSNSEQTPSHPLSPPPTVFSPPSPDAGPSRTPPSSILSPSPPRSSSDRGNSKSSQMPASPSPSSGDGVNISVVAGIVGGVVVILALIIACLVCSRRKKKQPYYTDHGHPPKGEPVKQNHPSPTDHVVKLPPPPGTMGTPISGWGAPPGVQSSSEFSSNNSGQHPFPMHPASSPNVGGYGSKSQFSFEELSAATGGFAQTNILGQGGFGYVHKGVLPDGKEVAVKSLKAGSGQGDREFQAEVDIISRVHHRHLVTLVGYCMAGDKRMLVYEFIPNKTLEFHLHGKDQSVMAWTSRLRIAIGSAKGLAYLHEDCEPRIIHRDIKAANILLDFNFEAKVADFGLAKLTSDNFTHVSTRVMGTFGYLAPEYAASGKLSEKSDVFSFGVMLLELITGRRPVDPTNKIMEDSLVDWARPLMSQALEDGIYDKVVDPRLEDNYVELEMARMIACASACVRHSARRRPRMSQVVRTLEGASSFDDLNDDTRAGQSVALNTNAREIYDTRAYNADILKFKQMVLPNQELNSSESGGTSEFGLNPSSSSTDSRDMDIASPRKHEL